MKTLCKASFLLFLTAGCCTSETAPPILPAQQRAQLPDIPRAIAESGRGSAVPILRKDGKVWLLTAKHGLPLKHIGDRPVLDTIPHPEVDVALVSIEDRGHLRLAPLAKAQPAFGDKLLAIGWHLGHYLLPTDGRQGGAAGQMSCPNIFGASGGAVLNEQRELVGIISSVSLIRHKDGGGPIPIPHCSHYVPVVGLRSWIFDSIN